MKKALLNNKIKIEVGESVYDIPKPLIENKEPEIFTLLDRYFKTTLQGGYTYKRERRKLVEYNLDNVIRRLQDDNGLHEFIMVTFGRSVFVLENHIKFSFENSEETIIIERYHLNTKKTFEDFLLKKIKRVYNEILSFHRGQN